MAVHFESEHVQGSSSLSFLLVLEQLKQRLIAVAVGFELCSDFAAAV